VAPKDGDTVRVHYKGTLEDGSTFDSSEGRDPLEFTLGEGVVIAGFESAVSDLGVGESKKVTIPAEQAYGQPAEDAIRPIPLSAFPEKPEPGIVVELAAPDGRRLAAVVAEIGDEEVLLDFNHPLAGKDLTFEIELVEVVGGE